MIDIAAVIVINSLMFIIAGFMLAMKAFAFYERRYFEEVLRALESWGADEDGIHPEAWDVYNRTRVLLGKRPKRAED